ncbi:MAG TPA: hypothetical protein VNA30_07255 [Mycobacteriales bacterium]|nr:hypothetical protein [Mycobacteriales bacterium]
MQWGVRRSAIAAACALVVGGLALPALATGPERPAATVTVDCHGGAVQVPADYLGLSVEWSMVERWFGAHQTRPVQSTVTLLRSIGSTGVLRIGGNSQDGYRFDGGRSTANNKLFEGRITLGMVGALMEVAARSGWRVVLGLNLRVNDPAQAAALTRHALRVDRGMRLLAVEPGNEPTVYFGTNHSGHLARVARYVAALDADPVTRGTPIVGPALANLVDLELLRRMPGIYGNRMPFATWHHYANRPSITRLLGPDVETDWATRLAQVAAAAPGVPTRMGEGNSVGRGGMRNVSDVSGSAVWLADAMLAGAAAGLAGYNAHSWDQAYYPKEGWTSWYTPFVVRAGRVQARPGVYGMAMLRDLPGSRMCATTLRDGDGQRLRVYAAVDPQNRLRVWVLDKSGAPSKDGVLIVPPAGYSGHAQLSRLQDAGGCAGRAPRAEGARMGADGKLTWTPALLEPTANLEGYRVRLAPCMLALVEFLPPEVLPTP